MADEGDARSEPSRSQSGGGGNRDRPASVTPSNTVRVDNRDVLKLVSELLHLIHQRGRATKEQMAAASGIGSSRVNGFMNLGSQKVASISLSEVRSVLRYARQVARNSENQFFQREVIELCKRVVRTIYSAFELDGLSSTEDAFVSHLNVDLSLQHKFAAIYCGEYALIRISREGDLVIARLVLHSKRDGDAIVRFTNNPIDAHPNADDPVEGYIFTAGRRVFTIGAASGTVLRCAILEQVSLPGLARHSDLVGVRLGDTQIEKEPFAHRIYLWRIPDKQEVEVRSVPAASPADDLSRDVGEQVTEKAFSHSAMQMAAVADEFGVHPLTEEIVDKVEKVVPQIRAIIALLKEGPPERMPWGLGIPGRHRRGD